MQHQLNNVYCITSCQSTTSLKQPIATNPSITKRFVKAMYVTRYLSTRRLWGNSSSVPIVMKKHACSKRTQAMSPPAAAAGQLNGPIQDKKRDAAQPPERAGMIFLIPFLIIPVHSAECPATSPAPCTYQPQAAPQ